MIVAGLCARVVFLLLVLADMILIVSWWVVESSTLSRGYSMILWALVMVVMWALGIIGLMAAGRVNLGLLYGVALPAASAAIVVVGIVVGTQGGVGLTGAITLFVTFIALLIALNIGTLRVVHEILGAQSESAAVARTLRMHRNVRR